MIYVSCPQCGGDIEMSTFDNSDGDCNVINGIRSWTEAEIAVKTCDCVLSEQETDDICERAAELAESDDWYDEGLIDLGD